MNDHPPHAHGLRHDLEHLARLQAPDRRRALRLFGGLAAGSLPLLGLAGCGGASEDAGTSGSSSGSVSSVPEVLARALTESVSAASGCAGWLAAQAERQKKPNKSSHPNPFCSRSATDPRFMS